jgi:dTDP-4-dehydrorhamnose 3,5-epimerase-like enzyme
MSLIKWVNLKSIADSRGDLTIIEAQNDVPFDIKRIYYLTNLSPNMSRGYHAHRDLQQLAVCLVGNCRVLLDDGCKKCWVELGSDRAIRIEPMIWHEMHDFSDDCVFLVMASDKYDEGDYIRDYTNFMEKVNNG